MDKFGKVGKIYGKIWESWTNMGKFVKVGQIYRQIWENWANIWANLGKSGIFRGHIYVLNFEGRVYIALLPSP